MKLCAACNADLPKANFSKKQWKVDDSQRRCKVCVADNRELQVQSQSTNNNKPESKKTKMDVVVSTLETMNITDDDLLVPVTDEELFKQPPPKDDCPVCFLSFLHLQLVKNTCLVVVKFYAVGVCMHQSMMIKAM